MLQTQIPRRLDSSTPDDCSASKAHELRTATKASVHAQEDEIRSEMEKIRMMQSQIDEIESLRSRLDHLQINPRRQYDRPRVRRRYQPPRVYTNATGTNNDFPFGTRTSGTCWQDLQCVLDDFEEMLGRGEQPDAFTFSALFKACATRRPPACTTAEGLWADMLAMGIRPNTVVVNAMINVLASAADIDGSDQYYSQLERFGLKPDLQTFNSLMRACSDAGDLTRARKWFATLLAQSPPIAPDAYTFNALINAAAHGGDYERGFEAYNELETFGVAPNIQTITSALKLCALTGTVDRALGLWESARKLDLCADTVMWNALLNVCAKAGAVAKGFELWEEMQSDDGVTPDAASFNAILSMCGQSGDFQRLCALLAFASTCRSQSALLNDYSFPALINGCARSSDTQGRVRAFRWFWLLKDQLPWNQVAVYSLFRLLDQKYSANSSKYDHPNPMDKNTLNGLLTEAQTIFGEAVKRGLFADHILGPNGILLLAG
eukprot:907576_1